MHVVIRSEPISCWHLEEEEHQKSMERHDSLSDCEESDDEWFFDSVRRYEDLLIYDVHGFICSAAFCDDSRLLLAVSREQRHEVWELGFPDKLVTKKDAGLVKNRDFSLLAAGYTESMTKKMVYMASGVVTSGADGVHFYSIPQSKSESDVISLTRALRKDVKDASLASSGISVYVGESLSRINSFDLNSSKVSEVLKIPNDTANNSVVDCKDAISNMSYVCEKLFIGLRDRGNVLLYEPRLGKVAQDIATSNILEKNWTMDVSRGGDFVAIANSYGTLNVYDIRNCSKAIFADTVKVEENKLEIHEVCISPNSSFVSVCGRDTNVRVFNFNRAEVNNGNVFTHDGHRGHNVESIVTHLWHPSKDKLVLSADNTGKLEAWRFR